MSLRLMYAGKNWDMIELAHKTAGLAPFVVLFFHMSDVKTLSLNFSFLVITFVCVLSLCDADGFKIDAFKIRGYLGGGKMKRKT